jgi:hypothetical protein
MTQVIYEKPDGQREGFFMDAPPQVGWEVEFNDERYRVKQVRVMHHSSVVGGWDLSYIVYLAP